MIDDIYLMVLCMNDTVSAFGPHVTSSAMAKSLAMASPALSLQILLQQTEPARIGTVAELILCSQVAELQPIRCMSDHLAGCKFLQARLQRFMHSQHQRVRGNSKLPSNAFKSLISGTTQLRAPMLATNFP